MVLEKQWAAAHQPAKVIHLWSSEKDYSQLKNSQQNVPVISTQGLISKKTKQTKDMAVQPEEVLVSYFKVPSPNHHPPATVPDSW